MSPKPLINPAIEFFLIRHGETAWNKEGRLQGQSDIPLNPLGRDQAAAAGRSLKHLLRRRGVDPASLAYVASPLGRARDTMERVRIALGLLPSGYGLDDRLKELSFGAWEGLTWPDIKGVAPDSVRARKTDKWHFVPPGGESYADLAVRLAPWVASLQHHDVVVAHGGVARSLMWLIAGCPAGKAPDVDIWQGRVLIFREGRCSWD